jgi:hypothetical protein
VARKATADITRTMKCRNRLFAFETQEWQSVGGSQSKGRSVDEAELHRFTLLLAITASGHSSFTFRRVNRSTRCSRSDPLSPILCSCKLACSSSAEAEALFELFEA